MKANLKISILFFCHIIVLLLCATNTALAAKDYIGIPEPSFGLDEVAPSRPAGWPSQEVANFYYIDNTHPSATNSSNTYGTPDKPRTTIPEITYSAGAYVEIHGGPYRGGSQIIFTGNGTAQSPVWIRGQSSNEKGEITGEMIVKGSYVIIENLVFSSNSGKISIRPHNSSTAHHISVRNNEMYGDATNVGNASAIAISGAVAARFFDIVVANNLIYNRGDVQASSNENDYHGVAPSRNVDRVWILDNVIHNMGGDSVQVGVANMNDSERVKNIYLSGNNFYDNHENALDVKESNDVIAINNLFHGFKETNSSAGEAVVIHNKASNVWIINNKIYDALYGIITTESSNTWFIGNLVQNIHTNDLPNWDPNSGYSLGAAIHFRSADGGAVNNTLYNNDVGIQFTTGGPYESFNNIIFARAQASGNDLRIANSGIRAQTQSDYNLYDAASLYFAATATNVVGAQTNYSQELNSPAEANPLLVDVNANLFEPQNNSPAVNSASLHSIFATYQSNYGESIAIDINGVNRPQQSQWDIGAFEFANSALNIATSTINNAQQSIAFSQTLSATGGTPPYSWSLASGALPNGLSLSTSSGEISGTATESGTFNFTIRVDDNASATDTQAFSFQVSSAPPAGILNFSASSYSTLENAASVSLTINRTAGDYGELTVDYSLQNETATAGNDFESQSGTLTFVDGEISKAITINLIDDNVYEGDETFVCSLSNITGGGSIGGTSVSVITITEDDQPLPAGSIGFALIEQQINENDTTLSVNVLRTDGDFGLISVNYTTTDGTAIDGEDYTTASGELIFDDGEISKTFNIDLINDELYESNETFSIELTAAQGSPTLTNSTSQISIINDDPSPAAGVLEFSSPVYSVNENSISIDLSVIRVNGVFGEINANVASDNGTATANEDYQEFSQNLVFTDGEILKTITIELLDDAIYEGDENFYLSLTSAQMGDQISTEITIIDDEPLPPSGVIQFNSAELSIDESTETANLIINRVNGSYGELSVNIASTNDSAVAEEDYQSINTNITFTDGQISQTLTMQIMEDEYYEGDETFSLTLTADDPAVLGEPLTTTITIVDNEPLPPSGVIQFNSAEISVDESAGTASLIINRVNGSYGELSVNIASTNDSAVAEEDYQNINTNITFTDGQISQTLTMQIIEDEYYEDDETFSLTLTADNPAVLGEPIVANITIIDDDPLPPAGILQLNNDSYLINESGSNLNVSVSRTEGSYGEISVDYQISDGSAVNGSDYSGTDGTLVFSDGQMSQIITINIIDDNINEDDENFNITLTNLVNTTIGNTQSASITIVDNDETPKNDLPKVETPESNSGGAIHFTWLIMIFILWSFRNKNLPINNIL
jgi:Calx-beta domain-containing protein/putative Ig domain-containing protein